MGVGGVSGGGECFLVGVEAGLWPISSLRLFRLRPGLFSSYLRLNLYQRMMLTHASRPIQPFHLLLRLQQTLYTPNSILLDQIRSIDSQIHRLG